MDNRPIGVFDSGLGGLSVVKELRKILPNENIVYFGDTGRVPYGTRGKDTILRYASQDIAFLKSHDVKMVVAACGTVSSTITEDMIKNIGVPYTGVVVPAAQSACAMSATGRIGVIGTTATIRSLAFGRAIRSIRPNAVVIGKACPLFVPLVENGLIDKDNEITKLTAKMYLDSIKAENVDTLILGCTHFPIIYDIISEVMDYSVVMVDPGKATAEHVKKYLIQNSMLADSEKNGDERFFVSDSVEDFSKTASLFLGYSVSGEVERVDIERF